MKTKTISLTIICLLILIISIQLSPVKAQEKLDITISPDGTIEPNTKLFEQNGNVYTFKGDISGTIDVHANNIVIDGAGYTLNGGILLSANHRPYNEADYAHAVECCLNVVVKNLKIINGGITSGSGGKNYTFIGNYFENARIRFIGNADGGEDLFTHNTFVNVTFDITYGGGGLIVLTENNLVNVDMIAFGSYFPKLDRNYYGDYTMWYSATRVTGSDVWSTPYVLSIYEPGCPDSCTVDSQPLVNPVTGFEVPHFNEPLPAAKSSSIISNADTGSSSSGASAKGQTNANTESSFLASVEAEPLTGVDVDSGAISSDLRSSEQLSTPSYNLGMGAFIAGVLATIVAILVVITLVVKKQNK
jgi:hypothetical protein